MVERTAENIPNMRLKADFCALRLKANVVHGFGRGSKLLGFPTANMDIRWTDSPESLNEDQRSILTFASETKTGVYFGWAQVVGSEDQGIYKAAVSVGWNPTFADLKAKTVEVWILKDFEKDFYEKELRLIICGYVRPELKFDNVEDLSKAINEDGEFSKTQLDLPEHASFAKDAFFRTS